MNNFKLFFKKHWKRLLIVFSVLVSLFGFLFSCLTSSREKNECFADEIIGACQVSYYRPVEWGPYDLPLFTDSVSARIYIFTDSLDGVTTGGIYVATSFSFHYLVNPDNTKVIDYISFASGTSNYVVNRLDGSVTFNGIVYPVSSILFPFNLDYFNGLSNYDSFVRAFNDCFLIRPDIVYNDFNRGYELGRSEVSVERYQTGFGNGYNLGIKDANSSINENSLNYRAGFTAGANSSSSIPSVAHFFSPVKEFLNLELLPGISLGIIFSTVVSFFVGMIVLKLLRG